MSKTIAGTKRLKKAFELSKQGFLVKLAWDADFMDHAEVKQWFRACLNRKITCKISKVKSRNNETDLMRDARIVRDFQHRIIHSGSGFNTLLFKKRFPLIQERMVNWND